MADSATKPSRVEIVNTTVTFQKYTNTVTEKNGHNKENVFFLFHISYLTGEKLCDSRNSRDSNEIQCQKVGGDDLGSRRRNSPVAGFY